MKNFRLGYIAETDTKKLTLSNYDPTLGSALVLLDRDTGRSVTIAR